MSGRSIRMYLVDGEANGLITAEIGQWTGKALCVPRHAFDRLAKRDEAKRTGVYVLMGPDPDQDGQERVYIGEGEDVLERLRSHVRNKDFWTRLCLFTVTDENLTKAHVKYLESRLVEMALDARRCVVDNGNVPPRSGLPEADLSDMEVFLGQMQILLPVLGFPFAQPSAEAKLRSQPESGSPTFELSGVGASALAREIDGEFVVLQGSTARVEGVPSWTAGKATRDRLVEQGVLAVSCNPEFFEFVRDHAFGSPSIAGAAVLGRNTNGRVEWKIKGLNTSYADWVDSQAAGVERSSEAIKSA